MKCSWCEEEILENEKFYEIDDEFYCDSCVEEETFYRIDGDKGYHEEEVGCYRKIEDYINAINIQIEVNQQDLEYYSKKYDEISRKRTEQLRLRIKELKEKKKRVLVVTKEER